jgi:uncharacterized membrane protein YkoI
VSEGEFALATELRPRLLAEQVLEPQRLKIIEHIVTGADRGKSPGPEGSGVWMLLSDASASNAAPGITDPNDVYTATANLELLHRRTMEAARANDDDDRNETSWGHTIAPEQAVMIAQHVARGMNGTAPAHSYINLETPSGRPVYAVRIGGRSVYVDADTGAVVR